MKAWITVSKDRTRDALNFYLNSERGSDYLFTQRFSKGVYEYFRSGRSEREIMNYSGWKDNKRLDKTIEKIPMYIRYVRKNLI